MRLTLHRSNSENVIPLIVYTSTLPRSIDTIQPLRDRVLHVQQQSSLNIVDMGECDGMTVEELAKNMPGMEFALINHPVTLFGSFLFATSNIQSHTLSHLLSSELFNLYILLICQNRGVTAME